MKQGKQLGEGVEGIMHHYINNIVNHYKSKDPKRIKIAESNYNFLLDRYYILHSNGYDVANIATRMLQEIHKPFMAGKHLGSLEKKIENEE